MLRRAARARAAGLGIVAALDHQARHIRARHDQVRPALHRLHRQRCALGDMTVGVDDPHLCKDTTPALTDNLFARDRAVATVRDQTGRRGRSAAAAGHVEFPGAEPGARHAGGRADDAGSGSAGMQACAPHLRIQDHEIERNLALSESPTLPAIHRYTGVLYDALDIESLRGTALSRAYARLAIGSALFGLVGADDPIPAYRLSASSKLTRQGDAGGAVAPGLFSRCSPTSRHSSSSSTCGRAHTPRSAGCPAPWMSTSSPNMQTATARWSAISTRRIRAGWRGRWCPAGPNPTALEGGRLRGTGGDMIRSFNISTAAAIVASAAGSKVAKHGNRSFSGYCGSADFLEHVGLDLNSDPARVTEVIEKSGIGFLYSPKFHPAMRNAASARKAIGIRSVFNIVGPLSNPCTNISGQVVGVFEPALLETIPIALQNAHENDDGWEAMVVHAYDGFDELSNTCENDIVWVVQKQIKRIRLHPKVVNIQVAKPEHLLVHSKEDSIRDTLQVIYGIRQPGKRRHRRLKRLCRIGDWEGC